MAKETFKYKIAFSYIDSNNSEITINQEQVHYVAIDKDYDNTNMPVIAISCSIEKDILDDMISNMNNNIVTLGIYIYDAKNQNDSITTKYFHDRFIYIIKEDLSKTSEIDYVDENTPNLYKDVVIWLLQQDAVNNNRQSINGVFKNATMNTLILHSANYLGPTLLEPIKYDNKYDQVIIPPLETISEYIAFLNNNLSVFYDTEYRFFIDFDITYITSSSGKVTIAKNQDIFTVELSIKGILPDEDDEDGMIVDERNGKYSISINNANVSYNKNHITNKMMNSITVIDSLGNVTQKDIYNNKIGVTGKMNKIVHVSNTDGNVVNNLSSTVESNNVVITVIKNDLDASIFTINKEYIITDPIHGEYAGRYILVSNKQLFIKQMDYYTMVVILKFRKI